MKKNVSFGFAFFLVLLYSAIQVLLLSRHEPWFDEAQAWLIARDLDIVSIFKQMAYEGTPALWHMLLVPLAKSGAPYTSEFILHIIIAVAAVTIFVLYAPFSKITKVLFIFSYYMAYEYSIIARSYGLSILLLFLIAALYNKRFEYPLWYAFLIFLLFNTNVHSFFISFSLTILFAWEFCRNNLLGRRVKIAALIMLMGGSLSFLQLLSPQDNINYGIVSHIDRAVPFIAIANALFPWHNSPDWAMPKDCCLFLILSEQRIALVVIAFLIFFTIILSMNRKPAALFILLSSFAGLFYILAFKHPGALRHHGFILIILLFSLWISEYYNISHGKLSRIISNITFSKFSIVLINACLALSLIYSLKIQYMEYKYVFSGAKEMADFMQNRLDHFTVIAHRSVICASLLPYLPGTQFWYADIENYGTLITYNKKYLAGKAISNNEVISRVKQFFPDQSQTLLLLTSPLDFPKSQGYRLLYKIDKDIFGYGPEKFYLYQSIDYRSIRSQSKLTS